jgi:hypothetical protein
VIRQAHSSARLVTAASVLALVLACGKSMRRTGAHGDEAGAGGAAASGGRGGGSSGGRGGAQSNGGSIAPGGRGATGGAGGGQGGTGGAGGRSPAGGSGGDGGCSVEEVEEDSLAHCQGALGDEPVSTCTFEATCAELGCGHPWSQFDLAGCRRRECTSQADCSPEHRCLPSVLAGATNCYSSVYEQCDPDCGECVCVASSDCSTVAFCQPTATFPPESDCPVEAIECERLSYFRTLVETCLESGYGDDITSSLEACVEAIAERFDECRGGGGAPGL